MSQLNQVGWNLDFDENARIFTENNENAHIILKMRAFYAN